MTPESIVTTWVSDIIAGLGLIVAVVSLVLNYRLRLRDKEQDKRLADVQLKLQELQLQKEEEAAERRASSRVEARYVLVGLKSHRIRISNTGGTPVTNVTCEYDENSRPYAIRQDKEPYEFLEPGDSFDEVILFADGSPSKFVVKTRWVGADGKEYSRDNIVSR